MCHWIIFDLQGFLKKIICRTVEPSSFSILLLSFFCVSFFPGMRRFFPAILQGSNFFIWPMRKGCTNLSPNGGFLKWRIPKSPWVLICSNTHMVIYDLDDFGYHHFRTPQKIVLFNIGGNGLLWNIITKSGYHTLNIL